MAGTKRTTEELREKLLDQIRAMRSSAAAYDGGEHWEADRLATCAYTLLHDGTGRTKSLLGMLGHKNATRFLSSKVIPPSRSGGTVIAASATLIVATRVTTQGAEYVPMLGDHPLARSFQWLPCGRWYEESIFHPLSAIDLNRKNIIFTLRTQDGGSHVDDAISDQRYAAFSKDGDPGVRFADGGLQMFGDARQGKAVANGVRATMRQIAWELDQSLIRIGF